MVHVDFSKSPLHSAQGWRRDGPGLASETFLAGVTLSKDVCLLHWSEIQTCVHLNFYFYTDLLLRILSPLQQLLMSALNTVAQKIPVFPLQSITVTGRIQTLGQFGLGNDGFGL